MDESFEAGSSSDEESYDGETILLQGFRQTRNRTNWNYRGSSMTTSDRMDIADLRVEATDYETALAYIASIFGSIALVVSSRMRQGLQHERLSQVLQFLSVAVGWIACHIEMVYLDIEDKLYYVHRARRFIEPRFREIDEIEDHSQSEQMFGFRIHELHLLKLHWRIPRVMRSQGRVFSGEEAMLIFLYHIRTGTPNTHIARETFGGDPRMFTHYIRVMVDHLYSNFYHKISGDSMSIWLPYIDEFREAIWDKLLDGIVRERNNGESNLWEVWLPFETFRIFGWLDDTDMATARPRAGETLPTNERVELRDTQQAFYNRYFRAHGLKAQVLLLPNGMIGSIFICSLRHNDNGVQNLSGLNEYLVSLLQPLYQDEDNNLVFPAVYGDAIFTPLATISRPYTGNITREQRIVNTRMSSLREDIEHKFSQIFNLYQLLRTFIRHHLFWNGEHVRKKFFTCLFVSNCYTCFNESRNRAFNLRAPRIWDYLPLDEMIVPAPETPGMINHPHFS